MAYVGNTNTTQAFTPAIDYFSGNGSTTAFTLSRPVASVAQVQVVVNNVAQNPSSAYTVSGNTITFTSAPLSGTNNIYVYYTSPITQVIAPGQGTVNTTSLGNITNIASGNSSLTLQTGTTPTTALTINTSQNVGIGTSSPDAILHTVKTSSGASTVGAFLQNSSATTSTEVRLAFAANANSLSDDRYGWVGYVNTGGTNGGALTFATTPGGTPATERMRIDSSGNLLFNSGYGSVATAYGCRAWVNFNGTGTVAIRASGNVTSITDNGVGDYTINFTTAMPDANYSVETGVIHDSGTTYGDSIGISSAAGAMVAGSIRVTTWIEGSGAAQSDKSIVCISVHR